MTVFKKNLKMVICTENIENGNFNEHYTIPYKKKT